MNCILAGVGGQGIVLASKLIAQAAMARDLPVRTAETIGMAQRGGCVVSHVRFGSTPDDGIVSPLIPLHTAELALCFEPGEATRTLPYLAPVGTMIVATTAIQPVMATLDMGNYNPADHLEYLHEKLGSALICIDAAAVVAQTGTAKTLNVALLGAACACKALPFSLEEMQVALSVLVKPRFLEMNQEALQFGAQAVAQQS